MHLKSLDIRGFKSFAEATHIEFTTGLNLIIGPNGCGKSNLVDAIRWVLGEQNVRNLRGQKLEDVIFAGTDQKRALSMASVSLTLDNTDQILPSPYTEVMVNRRVYRSEQSEFYLNQQPVRLKDINQLFYGTGVGRKGYAIIGQGEIENLLSARPYDIRLMLEEASGLIRYRYQKEEAQERLRATDRDLQRLEDITGELANRLQELKIKAERASLYLAVSSEQQALRTLLLKSEWGILKNEIDQLKINLAEHQLMAENGAQEVSGLEADHNRLFVDQQHLQQQLDLIKQQRYETANQLTQLTAQRTNLLDRVAAGRLRSEELAQEAAQTVQQVLALRADVTAGSLKLTEENEILLTEKQRLQRLQQAWQQIVLTQQAKGEELEQLRRGLINKAQQAAQLRNQIKQAEDEINQFSNRLQQFELEIEQRSQFIKQAEEQEVQINENILQGQDELQQVVNEYNQVQKQLKDISLQREQLEQQLNRSRQAQVQAQHELQSLQTIENNYVGYSETVKKLMLLHKKQSDFMPGLLGVVGELIVVPPGLETAIEVALGRGLDNLVVATEADVRQAIALLNRDKLGRATFLPLDLLKTEPIKPALQQRLQQEPGVLGIASDLVSYPATAHLAFRYLLGRIAIVDNLEIGLGLLHNGSYNLRLVTRVGEVLLPQGAITGGKRQQEGSVLKRKARRQALVVELERLKTEEQSTAILLDQMTNAEKSLREQVLVWQQRQQEITYRINLLVAEKDQILQQNKLQNEQREGVTWQKRLLQQDVERRRLELETWETELLQSSQAEDNTQSQLEKCKQETDELLRQVAVDREKINTQEAIVKARERELAAYRISRQQIETLYQSALASCQQQEEKIAFLSEQRVQYEQQIKSLAAEMVSKDGEQKQLVEQEIAMQKQVAEFNTQAATRLKQLNQARIEWEKLQERTRQYELRLARQETEFHLFDQQLSEADKAVPLEPLSERKLRELRQREAALSMQVEQIGLVDPGSVDEFKTTGERFALLSTQHQDLTKARQSLAKLAKDSEHLMQGRFGDFLAEANASFSQTFVEIFGGGEAALTLLDDEDGGVELLVKMPGKKRQSLNMLSGGERSLTCIALIFSLLRLKPVPFCLLDEIDAALDEINLQRFANFIRQLAQDRQFIIISHRQGTIEIADTLYGVTMPQGGISTVLSMQMPQPEQMVS